MGGDTRQESVGGNRYIDTGQLFVGGHIYSHTLHTPKALSHIFSYSQHSPWADTELSEGGGGGQTERLYVTVGYLLLKHTRPATLAPSL